MKYYNTFLNHVLNILLVGNPEANNEVKTDP